VIFSSFSLDAVQQTPSHFQIASNSLGSTAFIFAGTCLQDQQRVRRFERHLYLREERLRLFFAPPSPRGAFPWPPGSSVTGVGRFVRPAPCERDDRDRQACKSGIGSTCDALEVSRC
jgi:hypothetical protein